MMKNLSILLIVALSFSSMVATAEPGVQGGPSQPVAVAVLNFANQAQGPAGQEWDWLEKGLADLVINDLSQHPRLQLVSRQQMQLAILRMEHDGGLLPEWQESIAKQLKAARAVFGTYRVDGEKATIQATVLDVLKDKPVGQALVEGPAEDILKLEKQLAEKVLAILTDRPGAKAFIAKLPVWTDSVPASKLLYDGVDHFDYGRYEEAWLHFRRALKQDATYADAKYWAARMYYYQLRYEHALAELEPFIQNYPKHPRTADAIREIVDAALLTSNDARQTLVLLNELYKRMSYQQVYEPHTAAPNAVVRNTMSAKVWLLFRIADIHQRGGNNWQAWLAFKSIYDQLREQYQSNKSLNVTLRRTYFNWGWIWANPNRIADEYPELTFRVSKRQTTYVVPKDQLSVENMLPWFIAEDGWVIKSVTASATFSANSGYPAVLWLRDTDGLSIRAEPDSDNMAFFLRARYKGGSLAGRVRIEFPRCLRSIAFNKFFEGRNVSGLSFEFELMRETETGSLILDGLNRKLYTMELPGLCMDGRYAGRADIFPNGGNGGWIPGRHKFWIRHSAETMPGNTFDPENFDVQIKPGKTLRRKLSMRYDYDLMLGRHGRVIDRIALSADYPPFIAGPSFAMKSWPARALSTKGGPRTTFIPINYYYEPSVQMIGDPKGQVFAFWHFRGDLWYATSNNEGKRWSKPLRMPVPVNSAHREFNPKIFKDHLGRYCLFFVSDRNMLRRLWPYVSTSTDLKNWTRPKKICESESAYLEVFQDRYDNYVVLQDGEDSIWMRSSSDLAEWSSPSVMVRCALGQAMYRPYVIKDSNGGYHLFFQWWQTNGWDGDDADAALVTGFSRDGRDWSDWRILIPPQRKVWDSFALVSDDRVFVVARISAEGIHYGSQWLFRDRTGKWWSNSDVPRAQHWGPIGPKAMIPRGRGNLRLMGASEQTQNELQILCVKFPNLEDFVEKVKWRSLENHEKIDALFE